MVDRTEHSALVQPAQSASAFPELPAALGSRLLRDLQQIPTAHGLLVAFSGGLDSLVLLQALAHWRHTTASFPLRALHVHHGLSPHADAWARQCQAICERLAVSLDVIPVHVDQTQGLGLEAAARAARYQAFAAHLGADEVLLLAHHQDDQAETLLLNLLRGAGVKGLAAMPRQRPLANGQLLRPLLGWSRADLEQIARIWGLDWIDDESNRDLALARNYVRHQVIPGLRARWPGAPARLAQSAEWCREADELLDELAAADLRLVADGDQTISLSRLERLSPARQRHVVRYWLWQAGCGFPGEAGFARIFAEILPARADATPELRWSGGLLRRYRDQLVLVPDFPPPTPSLTVPWDMRQSLALPVGLLIVEAVTNASADQLVVRRPLDQEPVTVRFRRGGESLRPNAGGRRRALKKLLQQWGVPPWQRPYLPLIFYGEALVAIPGYAVASEYQVRGGGGLRLIWRLPGDGSRAGQFD